MKNKYYTVYRAIIYRAKREKRKKGLVYYESHHIVPASLGGSNKSSNLVLLTAREHFIVHACLPRFVKSKNQYEKMVFAFERMSSGNSNQTRYINSRLFSANRRKAAKITSTRMTLNNPSKRPEVREKLREAQKNKRSMNKKSIVRWIDLEKIEEFTNKGWVMGYGRGLTECHKDAISMSRSNKAWIKKDTTEKWIRTADLEHYKLQGWAPGRLPSEKGSQSKMGWKNPGAKFYEIQDTNGLVIDVMTRREILDSDYPQALAKTRDPIFMTERVQSISKLIKANGLNYEKCKGWRSVEISRKEAEDYKNVT